MFCRDTLTRLNIPYQNWTFYEPSRIETRGNSSRYEQEIKEQSFPALLQTKFRDMSFSEMHEYLFERKNNASNFATFETFQQFYLTPEGSKFYFDIFGYEGDVGGSAEGIVEYYSLLDAEFIGEEIRPIKGMSALIRALAKSALKLGAKIYKGRRYRITSISKGCNKFFLKTSRKRKITVAKLVIAVPPGPFKKIGGAVAQKIKREPAFQSVKAFPAFKAAAVYSRAWWEDIIDGRRLLNPLEAFMSNGDCLGWTLPHGLVINSYFILNPCKVSI